MPKIRTRFVMLILALSRFVGSAPAATLTVDGAGSAPFKTITAAIAQAKPGDTIRVKPGTYQETVRPKSHLRIV